MTKFMVARRCLEVATDTLGSSAATFTPRFGASFSWMKHYSLRLRSQSARLSARSYSTQADNRKPATKDFDDGDRPPLDPEAVHADLLRRLTKLYEQEVARELIVPPFKRALLYGEKAAIRDQMGNFSFIQLYEAVKRLAAQISKCCGSASQSRVAFLCPNNITYVISQWACWFSGQVAVPLNAKYPADLLEYYIKDSDASLLLTTAEFLPLAEPLAAKLQKPLLVVNHELINANGATNGGDASSMADVSYLDPRRENLLQLNDTLVVESALNGEFYRDANALILYTSGTTGKPKGVVLSYANLDAQLRALSHAWQVSAADSVLHTLPLNHVHGTINALNLPLAVGAKCVMLPKFDSSSVWSYLLNVNMTTKERVNVFMGVPTMYGLLIREYDSVFGKNARMCDYVKTHCKNKIRLMISGSAPLPGNIFDRWNEITGHRLLERYGMTEIGMAISNPYMQDGELRSRRQGCVGMPLPGVSVRIVDAESGRQLTLEGRENEGIWQTTTGTVAPKPTVPADSIAGQLHVKGSSVFSAYWQRPQETASEFDAEGWFRTGDTARYENGTIRILGRTSVDIIKSGGFKLSALEIETALHEHPDTSDVAVLGLPDETWGQRVVAVISLRDQAAATPETFSIPKLLVWLEQKLPKQAIPKEVRIVEEIPRNAMGKINKRELIDSLFGDNAATPESTEPQNVVEKP
ncbi:malonate--CoA ligase ACSF3, mitochondrial [Anopheles marshallii]|uniref:malonate--CoA ligase ACSF3, mitochondrial n=1 Tax=Anopheles marshallii TaxID=1521116 RepID=UPI00237A13EE|nr:malonate--CoA ligase ACSF3, mitochondrial [Anopheles marshallii]